MRDSTINMTQKAVMTFLAIAALTSVGGTSCNTKSRPESPGEKLATGYRDGAHHLYEKLRGAIPSDPDVKAQIAAFHQVFSDFHKNSRKILEDVNNWTYDHRNRESSFALPPSSLPETTGGTDELLTEIHIDSVTAEPDSIKEIPGEMYRPYGVAGVVAFSSWNKGGKKGEGTIPFVASATRDGDWKFPSYDDIKREIVKRVQDEGSQHERSFRDGLERMRREWELKRAQLELQEAVEKAKRG